MDLQKQQNKLKINLIDYDLDKMWQAHPLINQLRGRLPSFLPKGLYDPQDLGHQVLFRLTTFDPQDITDEIIQFVIEEQFLILQDRLSKLNFDLDYIFRGLSGKYPDLNIYNRLELYNENNTLVAKDDKRSFVVEFRTVQNDEIISLFTNELHYIHQGRPKGETFAFYFAGDKLPWAIETTEPSVISKDYKRDALLANGIDPNKAIELTRFYTLPGAPLNAISLMDALISKYYKSKGIEALFTTTMPMYSKTKSTTIAGGINKPLLVKDLRHKFIPEKIQGKICYRHTTTIPEQQKEIDFITTHPNFPTMLVVEVYKLINEPSLKPLKVLEDGNKVIYARRRDIKIEEEIKFSVKDINTILEKINNEDIKNGGIKFSKTEYVRDTIYGSSNDDRKIRLRLQNNFENFLVEAIYKHKIDHTDDIKIEVEEIIYKGDKIKEALNVIKQQGDFKEENSYEKIRIIYLGDKIEITLDIYPYGVWLEIEGSPEKIWDTAGKLGYKKEDGITLNTDELYLEWNKKLKLKEFWDVRFGLTGEK